MESEIRLAPGYCRWSRVLAVFLVVSKGRAHRYHFPKSERSRSADHSGASPKGSSPFLSLGRRAASRDS